MKPTNSGHDLIAPPPINDATTASIMKLDTASVDYYVHKLLQDEPEAPTNEPRFFFASIMNNLNSELNLPGHLPQLKPYSNEPLMDPAVLSEIINNGQRVLATIEQTPATEPAYQVDHANNGVQISQCHDVGDFESIFQKNNREGILATTGILLEYIQGSKETRGASSCFGHQATEQTSEEATLKNIISDAHHQVDPHSYPYIWDALITAGFYLNPPSGNTMGQPARDQNFSVPGQFLDNEVFKRRIFEINNVCFEKTGPTRFQNQRIKIIVSAHATHSAPRYEDQRQVHVTLGTRKQGPQPPENSKCNDKSSYC
ncbi:hypothetical protein AYI68_g7918 [Smittium mucronatum]|uniref:Uncharacterized protein n=1 Tax=Smittium mucronatum TaxID=133383 RepID=A0A1R0GMC2_9FUNG|nr:hypothetical protein AYI68_g7918 [Smittium mucronatum]